MIEEKKTRSVHNLILENRRLLSVSGVHDVDSFDEHTVTVFTELGMLTIKGTDLHIDKFNNETEELSVSGLVNSLVYSEEEKRTASGFLQNLFR